MAIIVLTSAAGSSGVTSTWVGTALSWPSPVVAVEADPSAGSQVLAGYFRGLARPGLSELALAHRQGDLVEVLPSLLFPAADSQASFLPGIRTYRQAGAVAQLWPALLSALRDLEATTGVDVLVDAGRLGLLGSPVPLIEDADVVVLVTGSGLPELAAARGWLPSLEGSQQVGLLLVDPGHPYTPSEIERDLGVPVIATLPWEPSAARWWSHGEQHRRHVRTPLARAVAALGGKLRELAPSLHRAEVPS